MWLKLILLIIYVSILFILARIIEAVSWVESGNLSRRLLDPMTLSVLKLKALLEQRGIDFEGAVEKSELTELVESSGVVTGEELSEYTIEEVPQETNFTGGTHFFEQVEDAKDSVWLVQVISGHWGGSYLSDKAWNTVKKKVARFGVRVGNFDCKLDWRFCHTKGWDSSRLILGLPHDFESKSQVTLYTHTGPHRPTNINKWIKDTVSKKVHIIHSEYSFTQNWLTYKNKDKESEVRVIMFSRSEMPPLFYSALSVKFPGRVRFGIVNTETFAGKKILRKIPIKSPNLSYLVVTKEKYFNFGSRPGENINFKSFETFLKFLYPSLNDIFVCSLIISNCLTWFELCLVQGSMLKRLGRFIWCSVKFNVALLLIWMMLLTLFQLPFKLLSDTIDFGLKIIRIVGGSDFLSCLRADFNLYFSYVILVEFTFLLYIFVIGVLRYKRIDENTNEDNIESMEWNFAQFRTLEHLFYPVQPRMFAQRSPYLEWNQQEIPSLWMAATMSNDYIRDLPVWEYVDDRAPLVQKSDPDKLEDCPTSTPANMTNIGKIQTDVPTLEISDRNVSDDDLDPAIEGCQSERETQSKNKLLYSKPKCCVPSGYLEGTQCVICLENYSKYVLLCGLPCGHCFHKRCIEVWLTRDNHYCPVCRWPSNKPKLGVHLHSE